MQSDTPETDANTIHQIGQLKTAVVDVEFARKLERERDEARRSGLRVSCSGLGGGAIGRPVRLALARPVSALETQTGRGRSRWQ